MEQPLTTQIRSRPTLRKDDYVPIPSGPHEPDIRQAEDDSPVTGCCESLAKLAIECSSSSNHGNDEPLMEAVPGRLDRNRARRAGPWDEVREKLYADIERLQRHISERNERNDLRRARLEELKAQDEAEKWEDEIYRARIQELNAAQNRIRTISTLSTKEIFNKVLELNKKIAYIASEIIEAPLSNMKRPELDVEDTIRKNFRKDFLFLFQSNACPAIEDRQLVQAVLQIFLARSCADLVNCWILGHFRVNDGMSKLYDRILKKEPQMVAGKWRQLAFSQMPPGWNLVRHADFKTGQALNILACAGWDGDISRVQPLVRELMVMADELRKNMKLDIMTSDLQAWVAAAGTDYDPSTMKDVTSQFGEEKRSEKLHVLGSTEIGLKKHRKIEGSNDIRVATAPTTVLCVEPLRRRFRVTQTRTPQSDPTPRPLTRGRSFSTS